MTKEKSYILSIDQGTTSSRAILFDEKGNMVTSSQLELSISCKHSGWVEQDPEEIWETVYECIQMVLRKIGNERKNIKAIGITNQRETTILWDKTTGKPLYQAIVWQSRQSQEICDRYKEMGLEELIQKKTGLLINPYFSGSKIAWIFEHFPTIYEKAKQNEVLFGTVDTYLTYRLTEGKVHITDYTNAARTMLFNIYEGKWDQELLEKMNIPESILPSVVPSKGIYAEATILNKIDSFLHIPIASMMGDQQASLFGQCCFEVGDVKNTYGTGCFMLMNTGKEPVSSKEGLLTTIAWADENKITYALEGSVFVGGSAVSWLRDGLRMIEQSKDVEKSSDVTTETNGVYVVPAFVGLGTPYWDNDARGAIFGLTRATTKEHFINATVASIAYQSKDVMECMKKSAKVNIHSLAVDGGASSNHYLMQFQSDILDCKIVRPECLETTAMGVMYMAGLAVGLFSSEEDLKQLHQIQQIFLPKMKKEERDKKYQGWQKAIEATRVYKVKES